MYSHYYILAIFILFFSTHALVRFQCYHGESNGTTTGFPQIDCPTGICIAFRTACLSYEATTCYDDSDPLSIVKSFKPIQNVSLLSFATCNTSLCNENASKVYSRQNLTKIYKKPVSFDNLLWPSLRKPKNPKIMFTNQIQSLDRLYSLNGEKFEFIGQTFNYTKEVWIEYKLYENYYTELQKYKFTLDLINSKMKICLSDSKMKVYGSLNLNKEIIPGQIMNVTFSSKFDKNYTLWINNEEINYIFLESGFIKSVKYGGQWTSNKSPNKFQLSQVAPEHEPIISNIYCDEKFINFFKPNFPLNYTTFKPLKNLNVKTFKLMIHNNTSIADNEMIEYELRKSFCPNTAVVRFQIQKSRSVINILGWHFSGLEWYLLGKITMESCLEFYIELDKDGYALYCQNTQLHYGDIVGADDLKYLVKGPIRKFKC